VRKSNKGNIFLIISNISPIVHRLASLLLQIVLRRHQGGDI